jgi:hypothetical protein
MATSLVDVRQFEKLRPLGESDKVEEGGGSGRWRMGGFWFSRSAFAAGMVFSIGIMGYDGCLNLGFACQEQMKGFVEGVKTEIDRGSESGRG